MKHPESYLKHPESYLKPTLSKPEANLKPTWRHGAYKNHIWSLHEAFLKNETRVNSNVVPALAGLAVSVLS